MHILLTGGTGFFGKALLHQGRAGQACSVGSGAAVTQAELAHRVRDLLF